MKRGNCGQAMAEFIICVSAVFAFVFVAVPIFGRLIDLKMDATESARFLAWERTVWHTGAINDNSNDYRFSAGDIGSVAVRSDAEIQNSLQRVIGAQSSADRLGPIFSYDKGKTVAAEYRFHAGGRMVDSQDLTVFQNSLSGNATPSSVYGIVQSGEQALDAVRKPLKSVLKFVGNRNEDFLGLPLFDGDRSFYAPKASFAINPSQRDLSSVERYFYQTQEGSRLWNGLFHAGSAIVAEPWSVQSESHYLERVDDFVPSTIFDNAILNGIKEVAANAEPGGAPIRNLQLADIGIEPFPTGTVNCDGGVCEF